MRLFLVGARQIRAPGTTIVPGLCNIRILDPQSVANLFNQLTRKQTSWHSESGRLKDGCPPFSSSRRHGLLTDGGPLTGCRGPSVGTQQQAVGGMQDGTRMKMVPPLTCSGSTKRAPLWRALRAVLWQGGGTEEWDSPRNGAMSSRASTRDQSLGRNPCIE